MVTGDVAAKEGRRYRWQLGSSTSQSRSPTATSSAITSARLTATVVFPVPPLPLATTTFIPEAFLLPMAVDVGRPGRQELAVIELVQVLSHGPFRREIDPDAGCLQRSECLRLTVARDDRLSLIVDDVLRGLDAGALRPRSWPPRCQGREGA